MQNASGTGVPGGRSGLSLKCHRPDDFKSEISDFRFQNEIEGWQAEYSRPFVFIRGSNLLWFAREIDASGIQARKNHRGTEDTERAVPTSHSALSSALTPIWQNDEAESVGLSIRIRAACEELDPQISQINADYGVSVPDRPLACSSDSASICEICGSILFGLWGSRAV
jgi:hypothetical protein